MVRQSKITSKLKNSSLWIMMLFLIVGCLLTPKIIKAENENNKPDRRGEDRTYLTFPEWYIVYSAQEYGEFLENGGFPSQFPYLGAIDQFWNSYAILKKRIEKIYTLDKDTELVIKVIGVSQTVEYGLDFLYENSIGILSEASSFWTKTPEDRFADDVAEEYGQYLNQTAWYEFLFWEKEKQLWTRVFGWKSLSFRGLERRIKLSIEYEIKAIYGLIIKNQTKSRLSEAIPQTSLIVQSINEEQLEQIEKIKIIKSNNQEIKITTPRYLALNKPLISIFESGGVISSIEGNKNIMVTFISLPDSSCMPNKDRIIFSMPILTKKPLHRIAVIYPVNELQLLYKNLRTCRIDIEHFYDY